MDKIATSDVSRGIEKIPVNTCNIKTTHLLDFVYVCINIPGPTIERQPFGERFEGCKCEDDCQTACSCVKRFGSSYDKAGRLEGIDPYSKSMKPVYECNKSCKCSPACLNKVVQGGIKLPLEVFETESKGLGLRTLDAVPKDTFICEYAGEVLSYDTAKKRTQNLALNDSNYILVLKEHLGSGEVLTTYVDPMFIGNAGRFINHSCEPNLYMVPVRVNNSIPHLALFAIRDLEAGEELSYDYSGVIQSPRMSKLPADDEDSRKSARTPIMPIDMNSDSVGSTKRKVCLCGSSICRGYLPFDESLYRQDSDGT